ncbi:MAG TPA: Flp pilus assembly protein CpaB [Symbiobacteriaceae bacterium]|nr:Flp pilus assembly protein CpaB [Symbiobacteriaceae bacterium]
MWVRRLVLGLALVLAVAGVASFLGRLRDQTTVVVTKEYIPANMPLTPDKLTLRKVNRETLALIAPDAYTNMEDAANLVSRMDIPPGEIVRKVPWMVTVLPSDADLDLARFYVPSDMRLVGLRVDFPGAAVGLIAPGDRVDVIFTARAAGTEAVSQTILQAVEVFAIGGQRQNGSAQTDQKGASSPPPGAGGTPTSLDIALLVTPEQAQILALAKRSGGAIDLSLTPPNPTPATLTPTGTLTRPAQPKPETSQVQPPAQSAAQTAAPPRAGTTASVPAPKPAAVPTPAPAVAPAAAPQPKPQPAPAPAPEPAAKPQAPAVSTPEPSPADKRPGSESHAGN